MEGVLTRTLAKKEVIRVVQRGIVATVAKREELDPINSFDHYVAYAHLVSFSCALIQDEVTGLQVLLNDEWIDVHPRPGAFICNVGDMLQRW